MRLRYFPLACGVLLALAILPAQGFADAFCNDPPPYQYQNCGAVAPTNTFNVTSGSLISSGVGMYFAGSHADFSSDLHALVWRNGQLVYTGPTTPLNTDMKTYQYFQLVPDGELQSGDQIEFVYHVNDPNGAQDYYSSELNKNVDGLNHVWAEPLNNGQCVITSGPCVYLGFEDLPQQEGSDFDYNDFMAFTIGLTVANQSSASPVPEPSSILLLTGAPLAFALNKFRRFL